MHGLTDGQAVDTEALAELLLRRQEVTRPVEALRVGCRGVLGGEDAGLDHRHQAGQLADLVVWDHDLMTIDPESFMSVKPERTMLGGRWVYEA